MCVQPVRTIDKAVNCICRMFLLTKVADFLQFRVIHLSEKLLPA